MSQARKLKYLASINDEVLAEDTDPGIEIQYIDIGNVDSSGRMDTPALYFFGNAPSRARRIVRDGDVIISTVRTYLEAIAQIRSPPANLIVSTGFAVVRARKEVLDPRYCMYALREPSFLAEVRRRSVGVSYPAINVSDLASISIPVYSLPHQRSIADFLDRETSELDELVSAKETLLAILSEKRQALIAQTVTRGLVPRAPMRDSGLSWIGQIPAQWDVVPLMWLTQPDRPIMYGIVLPGPDIGEGVPIVKGGNVRPGRMTLTSLARTSPEIEAPYARARLVGGDLVYSIRGSIGDCEVVPAELSGSNITQDVARVAPRPGVDREWLRYALISAPVRQRLESGSLGAAVRGINIFDLKRARIPTPPEQEQTAIARHLGAALEEIEALVSQTERTLRLLRERRASLIAGAIKGLIDVEVVA